MTSPAQKPNGTTKIIAFLMLAIFLLTQVLLPIHFAKATDFGAGYELVIKEYLLDLIGRILAAIIVRALTNEIISWIQGDGGKNSGFVGNLEKEFRRQLDARGAEFLNKIVGVNLCDVNLKTTLLIALRTPGLRQDLECTVTGIVENVQDFFRDFQNGGWPAFFTLAVQPQNNPVGSLIIALDAKLAAEGQVLLSNQRAWEVGKGFLGTRSYNVKCERVLPETQGGEIIDPRFKQSRHCERGYASTVEFNTKTPGGAVAHQLDKSLGSGMDWTIVADEIDEAIIAIANALINKFLSSSTSGDPNDENSYEGGGGISDTELGKIVYTPDAHTITVLIVSLIDRTLLIAQEALTALECQ